jgi:hypothetical protein
MKASLQKRTTEMISTDLGRRAEMFPVWLYALRVLTIASLNLVLLMKGYAHWGRESSMSIY